MVSRFAEVIRRERRARSLSQQEIGALAGTLTRGLRGAKLAVLILFWTGIIAGITTYPVARADEHSKLKIGILLSLSGGLEQWCNYIRQGVELAASEHSRDEVQIVIEDDLSGLSLRGQ